MSNNVKTLPVSLEHLSIAELLTTAEQAAYQASFNRTKKQQARDKGAEDAGGSALERARQRALGVGEQQAPAPRPVKSSGPQQFVQVPARGTTYRVPDPQWYALSSEQQNAYLDAVDGEATEAKNESLALQYSMSVGDQQASDAKRITQLESQLAEALEAVYVVQRRMDNIDLTVEATKSDALVEAESQLAQSIVNAGTVKSQLDSSTANSAREMEIQQADHRARFEASERVLGDMEGRLKSTGTLYQERGNAVVSQLASIEGRVAKTEVTQVELEGRTDALGTPITRDEMRAMVTSTVAAEFPAQLPAMVSKELAVQKATGELGEGIEIDRGYLSQSLENSDERSKRFEISEQQIEESKFTNPTERAIKRALKKGGRG